VLLAGLDPESQAAGLDSFIGWALYCARLGRQELKQLCVHALSRHVAAAQNRWASLVTDCRLKHSTVHLEVAGTCHKASVCAAVTCKLIGAMHDWIMIDNWHMLI
jgi:hypothetical protein